MKILFHACCGPCCLYPIEVMKREEREFALYYTNVNIHPFSEWQERKKSFVAVATAAKVPYWVDKDYPLEDFLQEQLLYKNRCECCYVTRLAATAKQALAQGYDGFSTTLLVSPYQDQALIEKIGKNLAEVYGLTFYQRDFRPGFSWAQEQATVAELYRQKYCGCIFSERDRYLKRAKSRQRAEAVAR